MYILTDKNGVIICVSPTLDYQENGNPLVRDRSGNEYAIAESLVGEISADIDIPDGVEPQKYTWIDGEFAENPDYTPIVPDSELGQQVTDLQLAITEIYESILGGDERG